MNFNLHYFCCGALKNTTRKSHFRITLIIENNIPLKINIKITEKISAQQNGEKKICTKK